MTEQLLLKVEKEEVQMQMNKQWICTRLGNWGCYFLSIVYLAEKYLNTTFDVVELYQKASENKWCDDDCYMVEPAAFLGYLIGKKVSVRHDDAGYKPKGNELEITRYELKETGVTYGHFVVTRNGELEYDPYGESKTRKKGKAVSTRIFTIED